MVEKRNMTSKSYTVLFFVESTNTAEVIQSGLARGNRNTKTAYWSVELN